LAGMCAVKPNSWTVARTCRNGSSSRWITAHPGRSVAFGACHGALEPATTIASGGFRALP
jgi:hypothetical protein